MTTIDADFPPPPKVSERPEKQQEFEQWYYQLRTSVLDKLQALADVVDAQQVEIDALKNQT